MFRIGTTSYIIPADILPNVEFLATRVDDVQLVLFETDEYGSNLPDAALCDRLNELAAAHGLTYTVHLPLDLRLGDGGEATHVSLVKARRVIEATAGLRPYAYTVHLDGYALPQPLRVTPPPHGKGQRAGTSPSLAGKGPGGGSNSWRVVPSQHGEGQRAGTSPSRAGRGPGGRSNCRRITPPPHGEGQRAGTSPSLAGKGPGGGSNPGPGGRSLARWQENARRALEVVCGWLDEPERLCVENLERWDPEAFAPVVAALPISRTIDIGHLWLQGADPLAHLSAWVERARVVHIHGIAERDHASLAHVPADRLDPVIAFLAERFTGVLTLEVFNQADLASSQAALAAALARVNAH